MPKPTKSKSNRNENKPDYPATAAWDELTRNTFALSRELEALALSIGKVVRPSAQDEFDYFLSCTVAEPVADVSPHTRSCRTLCEIIGSMSNAVAALRKGVECSPFDADS